MEKQIQEAQRVPVNQSKPNQYNIKTNLIEMEENRRR